MIYIEEKDNLQYTYSDIYTIRQVETGIEYYDAVDIIPCIYTYEETENLKDPVEEEQEEPRNEAQENDEILN